MNKLNREGPFPDSIFQFIQLRLELNKYLSILKDDEKHPFDEDGKKEPRRKKQPLCTAA